MGVAVGSINIPATTGNISVTGLAWQPVVVLFWNTVTVLSPPGMMFGCATASDEQWVIWTGTDAETSGYTRRYNEGKSDACVFNSAAPFTGTNYEAVLVSLNSDGFTINFTTRNASGEPLCWMAIGGDHIPAAYAGTLATGASTGTESVTAPGFTPTALIVAHTRSTFDAGQQGDMAWGVGVTDGTNQFSSFAMGNQGSIVEGYYIDRTDEVACAWDGSNAFRMALDSFDTNGFTVDVTDAWGSDLTLGYLAIQADAAMSGNSTVPLSTGTQTHSGLPLKPEGVFFCWPGADSADSDGSGSGNWMRPGVGGFTSSQAFAVSQVFRGAGSFGVWTPDGYQDPAGIIIRGSGTGIGGGDNDDLARGEWDSSDQGSFTIDWVNIGFASARTYGWLALPGELPFMPQFYRVQPGGRIT